METYLAGGNWCDGLVAHDNVRAWGMGRMFCGNFGFLFDLFPAKGTSRNCQNDEHWNYFCSSVNAFSTVAQYGIDAEVVEPFEHNLVAFYGMERRLDDGARPSVIRSRGQYVHADLSGVSKG